MSAPQVNSRHQALGSDPKSTVLALFARSSKPYLGSLDAAEHCMFVHSKLDYDSQDIKRNISLKSLEDNADILELM